MVMPGHQRLFVQTQTGLPSTLFDGLVTGIVRKVHVAVQRLGVEPARASGLTEGGWGGATASTATGEKGVRGQAVDYEPTRLAWLDMERAANWVRGLGGLHEERHIECNIVLAEIWGHDRRSVGGRWWGRTT